MWAKFSLQKKVLRKKELVAVNSAVALTSKKNVLFGENNKLA